ncbi:MAG: flagellin [Bacillota bacterium]
MRINTNVAALNSYNQLKQTNESQSKSLERLSSGKRINRASDDAAGLAISEKMTSQTKGLGQAQRNAQDGISMIQTAEGALKETHSILQRTRELAVQASNDSNTDADREEIQGEIDQLTDEVDRIANNTEFNTKKLLEGSQADTLRQTAATTSNSGGVSLDAETKYSTGTYTFTESGSNVIVEDSDGNTTQIASGDTGTLNDITFSADTVASGTDFSIDSEGYGATGGTDSSLTFHIGANEQQNTKLGISSMKAADLGVEGLDVTTQTGADEAIATVDKAISDVSSERSKLGAKQNRLNHTINNLSTSEENLKAANSRIKDVDMASEMMNMSKQRILSQAGTAMLAQANQKSQGVLQLLG